MLLSNILTTVPSRMVYQFKERSISHITHDSRDATSESIFVAIQGAQFDGSQYIDQCDAQVIIVDREVKRDTDKTIIFVEDSRRAMALFAAELFGQPSKSLSVVGLTGTNGKTTTSAMLYHILRDHGKSVGIIGTMGHHINGIPLQSQDGHTTPESSHIQAILREMTDQQCDVCIIEVSSIGLELARVDGIHFSVAAFTNFTQDHLNFHGDMTSYFQAKARLFTELLDSTSQAILNGDQPEIDSLHIPNGKKWTFGQEPSCDWKLSAFDETIDRSNCQLEFNGHTAALSLSLVGRYNVYNATLALAIAESLGTPWIDGIDSLRSLPQISGRVERVAVDAKWTAFVDYAHTPDALSQVLITLRAITIGRLVIVFGCGGNRDREKRPIMGAIAQKYADQIIVTSDNPRDEDPQQIISEIIEGISVPVQAIVNRREAIRYAISELKELDVLLVAGKGHETIQIIGNRQIHFDDVQEIMEAL